MMRRGHSDGKAAKWSTPRWSGTRSGSVGTVQTEPGSLPLGSNRSGSVVPLPCRPSLRPPLGPSDGAQQTDDLPADRRGVALVARAQVPLDAELHRVTARLVPPPATPDRHTHPRRLIPGRKTCVLPNRCSTWNTRTGVDRRFERLELRRARARHLAAASVPHMLDVHLGRREQLVKLVRHPIQRIRVILPARPLRVRRRPSRLSPQPPDHRRPRHRLHVHQLPTTPPELGHQLVVGQHISTTHLQRPDRPLPRRRRSRHTRRRAGARSRDPFGRPRPRPNNGTTDRDGTPDRKTSITRHHSTSQAQRPNRHTDTSETMRQPPPKNPSADETPRGGGWGTPSGAGGGGHGLELPHAGQPPVISVMSTCCSGGGGLLPYVRLRWRGIEGHRGRFAPGRGSDQLAHLVVGGRAARPTRPRLHRPHPSHGLAALRVCPTWRRCRVVVGGCVCLVWWGLAPWGIVPGCRGGGGGGAPLASGVSCGPFGSFFGFFAQVVGAPYR